jgi:hypothetical protein
MPFQIGDVVKRIAGEYNNMNAGTYDIITSIDGGGLTLMRYGNGHTATQFSFVRNGVVPKFKVGDIVEYLGTGCLSEYTGHKFEVATINAESYVIHCHGIEPMGQYTAENIAKMRTEYQRGNWMFNFYEVVNTTKHKGGKVNASELYLVSADNFGSYLLIRNGKEEAINYANNASFNEGKMIIFKLEKIGTVELETKIKEKL